MSERGNRKAEIKTENTTEAHDKHQQQSDGRRNEEKGDGSLDESASKPHRKRE
ncbi:MAG: hypothetical protein IKC86_04340 [Prevotella sp.]|nr:hypothetical protein [Prevotella sp.]